MPQRNSISRRDALIGVTVTGIAGLTARNAAGYDFSQVTPAIVSRVHAEIEIEGNLLVGPDSAKARKLGLQAKAELKYLSRRLSGESAATAVRTVREYEVCQADVKLRDRSTTSQLDDERQIVVSESGAGRWRIFSPVAPLTREETDLLKSGVNVDAVERLLPTDASAKSWAPENEALAAFLGIDSVATSDVKATSAQAKDRPNTLEVSAEGKVAGTIDGLDTQIEVKLKIAVDTEEHRVRWATAAVREKRESGNARPGFETLSKIKCVIQKADIPASLAEDGLKGLTVDLADDAYVLRLRPDQGSFEALMDPRWHLVSDKGDLTVLRLVDRNTILGQANIAIFPVGGGSTADSTAAFRAEVERSLSANEVEVVEADDATTSSGLRRLRVKAVGKLEGYEVQWIQYLISDDKDRRAALSFTCQTEMAERFGGADQTLVDTFQFDDAPRAAAKTSTSQR